VFDKFRKAVSEKVADMAKAAGLPPDLGAVPDVGGIELDAIDRGVLSAYLGREVVDVGPMGPGGAEATSFVGERFQARLREREVGADVERQPGELFPGQVEGVVERLRAQGMSEEMIRMARARMTAGMDELTRDGWSVTFEGGHRASVQVFPAGSEGAAEHDQLRRRYGRQHGTDGQKAEDVALLTATVQSVKGTPYESYSLKGRLAAQGPSHVAIAASSRVGTANLAALAAVALRSVEGRPA
jgi:hypothetical protein